MEPSSTFAAESRLTSSPFSAGRALWCPLALQIEHWRSVRARAVAVQTDAIFQQAVDMTKRLTLPGSPQQDYTLKLDFDDFGKTKSIILQ